MAVSLLPGPTRLIAEAIQIADAERPNAGRCLGAIAVAFVFAQEAAPRVC